jgi:hypothetical protein
MKKLKEQIKGVCHALAAICLTVVLLPLVAICAIGGKVSLAPKRRSYENQK